MQSIQKQYTNEMRNKFGYYATWTPDVHLNLGDIVTIDKNEFTRLDNLVNLGIPFEILRDNTKSNLEYCSEKGVNIIQKLAGKAAPQGSMLKEADAGIIVEFSKEKSVLFKSENVTSPYIDKIISLGKRIIEKYNCGDWKKEWFVITELKEAESATIIISNSNKGKIELKANADIGATSLNIADASLNFSVAYDTGLSTKIIASEGITPLFRLMGIKKKGSNNDFSVLSEEYSFELIEDEDFE